MGPGTAVATGMLNNPGKVFIAIIGFILTAVGFFFLIKYVFTSLLGGGTDMITSLIKAPGKIIKEIKFGKIGNNIGNIFCFDENTLVILKNGSTKKIIDVKIGDVFLNDSKVKGTMKFSGKDIKLTNYDGILTTSNHHVLHDGKFKRVSDVPNVINNIYDNKIQFVYDLETTDHRIVCLNNKNEYVVYTDYSEIDDEDNFIERYELSILNK